MLLIKSLVLTNVFLSDALLSNALLSNALLSKLEYSVHSTQARVLAMKQNGVRTKET